jgi:hypothetical protein
MYFTSKSGVRGVQTRGTPPSHGSWRTDWVRHQYTPTFQKKDYWCRAATGMGKAIYYMQLYIEHPEGKMKKQSGPMRRRASHAGHAGGHDPRGPPPPRLYAWDRGGASVRAAAPLLHARAGHPAGVGGRATVGLPHSPALTRARAAPARARQHLPALACSRRTRLLSPRSPSPASPKRAAAVPHCRPGYRGRSSRRGEERWEAFGGDAVPPGAVRRPPFLRRRRGATRRGDAGAAGPERRRHRAEQGHGAVVLFLQRARTWAMGLVRVICRIGLSQPSSRIRCPPTNHSQVHGLCLFRSNNMRWMH